jgi:hypothetical protein
MFSDHAHFFLFVAVTFLQDAQFGRKIKEQSHNHSTGLTCVSGSEHDNELSSFIKVG